MILKYKTGKLPSNFIFLGVMLLSIGIWRMLVLDWKGILFFLISLVLLFLRSGVLIDTEYKRVKEYTSLIAIIKGKWESIQSIIDLEIINSRETQSMSVGSVSRTETKEEYKLILTMPDKDIELISGEKEYIQKHAEKISSALQVPLRDESV
jgi:hypothetical protein